MNIFAGLPADVKTIFTPSSGMICMIRHLDRSMAGYPEQFISGSFAFTNMLLRTSGYIERNREAKPPAL
jgi:hypothetical protein